MDVLHKWRVSREGDPRDRLRDLVSTVGLLQSTVAPLLLVFAVLHLVRRSRPWCRRLSGISGIVGLAARGFALYRGYFSSLGW